MQTEVCFCRVFAVVVTVVGFFVDKRCNAKYYPMCPCCMQVVNVFFFYKNVMRVFDMFFVDDVTVM